MIIVSVYPLISPSSVLYILCALTMALFCYGLMNLAMSAIKSTIILRSSDIPLHPLSLRKLTSSRGPGTINAVLKTAARLGGHRGLFGKLYVTTPVVHITDYTTARIVLNNKDGVVKSPGYDNFLLFTGGSVFTAETNSRILTGGWKLKRHHLLRTIFKRTDSDVKAAVDLAISDILTPLLSQSGEINMLQVYQNLTFQTTHHLLTSSLFTPPPHLPPLSVFFSSLSTLRSLILRSPRSILPTLLPYFLHPLIPSNRSISHIMRTVIHPYSSYILNTAPKSSRLSNYVVAITEVLSETHNEVEIKKYLIDEVTTLMFAGQDTSAGTLAWSTLQVLANPSSAERVARDVEWRDWFIKETMRVTPVAQFVVRPILQDLDVEGAVLPAGALAVIWISGIHNNPLHYADPEKFDPSRWSAPQQNFLPFALGARSCPGLNVGKKVVDIALAHVASEYVLRGDASQGSYDVGFTVLPSSVNTFVAKRVYQTDCTPGQGDALRACVACIVKIDVEKVPNFVTDPRGYMKGIKEFLKPHKFDFVKVQTTDEIPRNSYCIVRGTSPRGDFGHVVVGWYDGEVELVHDPHRDGSMIVEGSEVWYGVIKPL